MNSCVLQNDEPRTAFSASPGLADGLDLAIDLRRAVRRFTAVVVTLVVTATMVTIVRHRLEALNHHQFAYLMNRFDLGFEPSVPNWYSSFSLLACSILLTVIAKAKARRRDPWVGSWRFLALLFAILAVGKGVRLNEIFNTAFYGWVDPQERFYTPWVIPAVVCIAIAILRFLPFCMSLDRHTASLFAIAGSIFILGTIGMDSIGGAIADHCGSDSVEYSCAQGVEELMEMLGVLVFLYALLDYLARHIGQVRLRIG